jgi:hypothetical protein
LYGTNEKQYKLLASNFLIEFPKTEIKIESTKDII